MIGHEIGLSTDVIESGLSLASLRPAGSFQLDTRNFIQRHGGVNDNVLRNCTNPLAHTNVDLTQLTMIKFGGDMLKKRVYTDKVAQELHIATSKILGWDTMAGSICPYIHSVGH